jgi:uncharacterized cupin superfamily protein
VGIAHWDEVEPFRRAKGEMDAEWQLLGNAAGTVGVGVNRQRIAPGKLSTPPHSHGASEEIVHVLGGSGLSWQDEQAYEVRARDTIVHLADHEEHTLRAGDDGLDVLVYGTRHPTEIGWLPRSSAIRIGWPWTEGRTDDPWDVEAEQPPLEFGDPAGRPSNIVGFDDVPDFDEGRSKELAGTAGSLQAGLNWVQLADGATDVPPHCHSEEEEVVVVLKGQGTLELWPTPIMEERGLAEREDIPIRKGHVIARPPGTKVAHGLRGGPGGMELLVWGNRKPNDICYYPRSRKIYWRGVGLIARLDHLAYDDGEPD